MGDPSYGTPPTLHLLATKYKAILLKNDAPPPTYANNYIQRPTSAFGGTRVYRSRRSLKKVASKAQRAINLASGGWKKAQRYASTLAGQLKQKARGKRQVYANAAALAIAGQAYRLEEQSRGHGSAPAPPAGHGGGGSYREVEGSWRCTRGCTYRGKRQVYGSAAQQLLPGP